MHLGSIYLIVNDFNKSIIFYEELLQISVTRTNMDRFAMFNFDDWIWGWLNEVTEENRIEKGFHDIYWDGESHYYIDGTVEKSDRIPLLIYDKKTGEYIY